MNVSASAGGGARVWLLGAGVVALALAACSGEVNTGKVRHGTDAGGPGGPSGSNVFVDTLTQPQVDKVDLLLMVDNSSSMADKQAVLKEAVPDLVARLVTPICVDASGKPDPSQPPGNADCAGSSVRELTAIKNIHVGVITSSLGDHGAHQICPGSDTGNLKDEENDDHGHLIATRPRWAREPVITPSQPPEGAGFLDWNPGGNKPGDQDLTAFNNTFQMMVTAPGEFGCGFESQLESIYRFLVDPNPPLTIEQQPCPGSTQECAFPTGRDDALLAERAAFLRPDSAVAVIMVTDENDCSIRDTQQYFYATLQDVALPHGTQICATDPNNACCYSCSQSTPPKLKDGSQCPVDPTCSTPTAPSAEQTLNLRCFHDKQRFGLDFLYPTQRYVNALQSPQICTSNADLGYDPSNPSNCKDSDNDGKPDIVPNPLYSDGTSLSRPQSLVFFAGIVGVPWQDLQAMHDKAGNPYTPAELLSTLRYKTAAELQSEAGWDVILGDPGSSPPRFPTDGLMVESRSPRTGSDVFGKRIPGPTATPADDNPINHHDWADSLNEDLMYACIFQLPGQPRNCPEVEKQDPQPGCDCGSTNAPGDNNPLCQDPATHNYGPLQYFAKAYPATRELTVLRDFGANAIVASICARNLDSDTAPDYGYRPAVDAIVDRLKEAFAAGCLPRTLPRDPVSNKTPCTILEVTPRSPAGCHVPGRADPDGSLVVPALARLRASGICDAGGATPPCSGFTVCEINQAGDACHHDVPQTEAGWCYVDPSANVPGQPGDDPSLVAQCPASEQRIIRFVDPANATPAKGAQALIACFGAI